MKRALVVMVMLVSGAVCSLRADGPVLQWNDPASVAAAAGAASGSIRAAEAEVRAAEERRAGSGVRPNPMLMTGVQNLPIDFSDDNMTMLMVGASQSLTRKSRRDLQRHAADIEVERLQQRVESERAAVERDARLAWLDAAAAQNQIRATEEIGALLTDVVEAARYRYEAGLGAQSDLIRAMFEQSNLEHSMIALRARRRIAVQKLLALLDLPQSTSVPLIALQQTMQQHQMNEIDTALPAAPSSIAALQSDVAAAETELQLARLAGKPDWSIEASYGARPKYTDMVTVIGRVELPLHRSVTIEPRIREAVARRDAASRQIDALRQQLRSEIAVAVTTRAEAIEQLNLHAGKLVPQAKLAFESSLPSYQNGRSSFDAVLETLRQYLELNVDYFNYLKQADQSEVQIAAIQHGARTPSAAMSANDGSSSRGME